MRCRGSNPPRPQFLGKALPVMMQRLRSRVEAFPRVTARCNRHMHVRPWFVRMQRQDVIPLMPDLAPRSEEHTSELQSLMRSSYAVFCLNKKKLHNFYDTLIMY